MVFLTEVTVTSPRKPKTSNPAPSSSKHGTFGEPPPLKKKNAFGAYLVDNRPRKPAARPSRAERKTVQHFAVDGLQKMLGRAPSADAERVLLSTSQSARGADERESTPSRRPQTSGAKIETSLAKPEDHFPRYAAMPSRFPELADRKPRAKTTGTARLVQLSTPELEERIERGSFPPWDSRSMPTVNAMNEGT